MSVTTSFLTDIKTAWVVAGTSATTGTATLLDAIPADIGKLGTIVSCTLGIVLIISHGIKMVREHRIGKLDLQLKRKQLDELNRDEKKD